MLSRMARTYDPNSKLSVVGAMMGAAGAILLAGFCLLVLAVIVYAVLAG